MNLQDIHAHSYIRLEDNSLKDINEQTRKIWNDALEFGDIIQTMEGYFLCDYNTYMILSEVCVSSKDTYGIENVNFSLINPGDERWEEYAKQRLERGFDDSETWNLNTTIARFILPRLKRFKEICGGFPADLTEEKWDSILDRMIKGFELTLSDKMYSEKENRDVKKALWLFYRYFNNLWW